MYDIPKLLAEMSPGKAEQLIYELERAGLVKRLDPSRELAKQLEPVRKTLADCAEFMDHFRVSYPSEFEQAVAVVERLSGKKAVGQ